MALTIVAKGTVEGLSVCRICSLYIVGSFDLYLYSYHAHLVLAISETATSAPATNVCFKYTAAGYLFFTAAHESLQCSSSMRITKMSLKLKILRRSKLAASFLRTALRYSCSTKNTSGGAVRFDQHVALEPREMRRNRA